MAETNFRVVVETAMQPLIGLEIPPVLRTSIERQSHSLMGLASSLLHSGMGEEQVRTIIGQACESYRDELISAILKLRGCYEPQL